MIRVTGFYVWREGASFNHEYYNGKHMDLTKELLLSHGLIRLESDQFLLAERPKPGDIVAASHAYFETPAIAQKAMAIVGQDLLKDVPNYTTLLPDIKMSKITTHL